MCCPSSAIMIHSAFQRPTTVRATLYVTSYSLDTANSHMAITSVVTFTNINIADPCGTRHEDGLTMARRTGYMGYLLHVVDDLSAS